MHWSKDPKQREEVLKKISNKLKGRTSPRKGIVMSEKQKKKISKSKIGKPNFKKRAKINKALVCKLYKAGDSSPVLAKKFGVASITIRRILEEHGIKIRSYREMTLNAIKQGRNSNSELQRKTASKLWTGKGNPRYRHGKNNGYKMIKVDNKWIPEHRYIMEEHLGRKLEKNEVVHHMNFDRHDNRIENLEVMTIAEHISLHRKIDGLNPMKCKLLSIS